MKVLNEMTFLIYNSESTIWNFFKDKLYTVIAYWLIFLLVPEALLFYPFSLDEFTGYFSNPYFYIPAITIFSVVLELSRAKIEYIRVNKKRKQITNIDYKWAFVRYGSMLALITSSIIFTYWIVSVIGHQLRLIF